MSGLKNYICPNCKKNLNKCSKKNNCYFRIIKKNIPCFTKKKTSKITKYETNAANVFYKNFLNWLFKTFKTNENEFRKNLFKDIEFKKNQKILIIGAGNGDDINFILKNHRKFRLKIYAQDLSVNLLSACANKFKCKNIFYNVSDARLLPFKDNFFDHVFHFGGINLFGNYKKSIDEMERVVKVFGSVTYGDEGIATWLRKTIFSKMMINNNKLWKFKIDLKNISVHANEVKIRYLLGNCFYLINYIYEPNYQKKFNYSVAHKSSRGGSVLERYMIKTGFSKRQILKNLNKSSF